MARGQPSGSTSCPVGALPAADRILFAYDLLGREKSINYPGTTPDVLNIYDANGNRTRTVRGAGGVRWDYIFDSADQVTEEKLKVDGRTYVTDYAYNAIGAVTTPIRRRITRPGR